MNSGSMDHFGPMMKLLLTVCAVAACVIATVMLGYFAEEAVIYTHFYYVPVVLAALWYHRRGLAVPIVLVSSYFLSLGASPRGLETNDYLRGVVLIVVGFVVSELSNVCSTARKEVSTYKDKLEDLVRKRTEELREANERLALMGRMTRHDLVNALSILSGWLELARESEDDATCRVDLGRAIEAEGAMRAALEFAGEYERIGAHSPVWLNLRRSFALGATGFPLDKVKVTNRLPGVEVYADAMLDKVFRNLVDNSLRHGGTVSSITVSGEVVGGALVLTYEDDGQGVSDADRPHLFEQGHGKHTGLGMYFARKVLGITGITIEERGVRGSGARFVVTVPAGAFRTVDDGAPRSSPG